MSTLFVNNLNTASGTTITVPSGKSLIAPNHVIQTTNTTGNTQTSVTTNNTWTATDAVVTITPKFNDSKIYLHHTAGGLTYAGTGDRGLRIKRVISGGGTSYPYSSQRYGYVSTNDWVPMNWGVVFIDSGFNTTSLLTYTIEIYKGGTGGEARHCDNATWNFVAMEIKQ